MALWLAVLIGLGPASVVCRGADGGETGPGPPAVTPYKRGSGNRHGYRIANWAYDAVLSCNRNYGLSDFVVKMGGEVVARTGRFGIYSSENECVFDAFQFHKNKDECTVAAFPGRVSWALSPEFAATKGVEYGGSVVYEARKITMTHAWTCRRDVRGRFLAGCLKLGIPLLTMCAFEATLADGAVVSGEIPAELPGDRTLFTPATAGKAITSILFHTRKGKVRIAFVPDRRLDMAKGNQLFLQTILHTYSEPDKKPYRRYELTPSFPLGETRDVARTYSIVFEFPE